MQLASILILILILVLVLVAVLAVLLLVLTVFLHTGSSFLFSAAAIVCPRGGKSIRRRKENPVKLGLTNSRRGAIIQRKTKKNGSICSHPQPLRRGQ